MHLDVGKITGVHCSGVFIVFVMICSTFVLRSMKWVRLNDFVQHQLYNRFRRMS